MHQCHFPDCGGVDCPCTARTSPTSRVAPAPATVPRTAPTSAVGDDGQDEAHERAINQARIEFEHLHAICLAEGSLPADQGSMRIAHDRWMRLLSQRSPAQVHRMLAAQAQRMAREPGA